MSRIGKEDREMSSGKDKMCSVRDLEPDTEHAVPVRCWERTNRRLNEEAIAKTQKLPAPSNVRAKSDT